MWLEPTAAAHIEQVDMTPDLTGSSLKLTAHTQGVSGETIEAVAYEGKTVVGKITGPADTELSLPVGDRISGRRRTPTCTT